MKKENNFTTLTIKKELKELMEKQIELLSKKMTYSDLIIFLIKSYNDNVKEKN